MLIAIGRHEELMWLNPNFSHVLIYTSWQTRFEDLPLGCIGLESSKGIAWLHVLDMPIVDDQLLLHKWHGEVLPWDADLTNKFQEKMTSRLWFVGLTGSLHMSFWSKACYFVCV